MIDTKTTWGNVVGGTAVGPTEHIEVGAGVSARVTALWSDTDGVVVDVEIPDVTLTSGDVARLTAALERAVNLPAPTTD
ncbi:hypothetical protein [Nocardioides sp.]|uniref:hypothetical protein n=1 Tax=Nocardioides sp. TaxID=35761 RepID=UPI0039E5E0F3